MPAFTLLHVIISLIAIVAGFVVVFGFVTARSREQWTHGFLGMTVATSLTGFGFPLQPFLPSHVVALISLGVLALAIYARYGQGLTGKWRATYVVTSVVALYLNVFVLIIQLFTRIPALHALAPTQSEPPFAIAQLAVLASFALLGALSITRFHPPLHASIRHPRFPE